MRYPSPPAVLFAPHTNWNLMSNGADLSPRRLTSASVVWLLLAFALRPPSNDRSYWWWTTGALLAESLRQARYSWIDQFSTLYFYYVFITPRLGPRPRKSASLPKWKSFMTDDFSPLEFSWTWSISTKRPEVRYSVEIIGSTAGTSLDPFNQLGAVELVTQLQAKLPQADWTWFNAFYNAFQTRAPQAAKKEDITSSAESAGQSSPSSIFLAFEHRHSKPPVPKAYFIPAIRALTTSDSPLDVVTKALASLPTHSSDLRTSFPAYTYLVDFLARNPLGRELTLIFLAIDCVPPPQESRLKSYFRSSANDFASASQILRLGNPTSASGSPSSNIPSPDQLQRLESLFHAILPLAKCPSTSDPQLPSLSASSSSEGNENSKHETAGLLFYFDCAPSQSVPRPKIYLPVKHYATSDESAWWALKEWLREERGEKYVTEWGTRFESLMGMMGVGHGEGYHCEGKGSKGGEAQRDTGNEKEQGSDGVSAKRVQTYVSVGFEESGKLSVTSYFTPGVYARRI